MKYFKLIGCLILIMFLVGCSESEWFQLFCSGKSDSRIFDSFTWVVCMGSLRVHPTYIEDSKCPEGFRNTKTSICVICDKNQKFDVSVEKCICEDPGDSMDSEGFCEPKAAPQTTTSPTTTTQTTSTTQTTQTIEPTKGNDCTFSLDCSTWPGYGTCADANNINRYDCINGYCKLAPFHCSGGCLYGTCK